MSKIVYKIADEFSQFPAGRFESMSDTSGEAFRKVLVKLLSTYNEVELVLDGAEGYPPSFLEEAFGGLVRDEGFKKDDLYKRLSYTANDPIYKNYPDIIKRYIKDAK